ncbi:MAG: DUF1937 family protein [Pseudomonadota bacterium]|nr:DUF1937 family protein [Pseudomonadota bacterium]
MNDQSPLDLEDLDPFAWGTLARHDRGQRFSMVSFDAAVCELTGYRPLVYLASPYSKIAVNADGWWELGRSTEAGVRAAIWSARFAAAGVTAISPIMLSADMCALRVPSLREGATAPRLDPLDAGFWTDWCFPLLISCDAVVVPPIEGRDRSAGVWGEVVTALSASKAVYWIGEG